MKKRKLVFAITAIMVFSAMMLTSNTKAQAAAKKTYTITPKSSPYKGKYKKAKGYYNSTTKQYFAIRSYLELLEKKGGGKLVIKRELIRYQMFYIFHPMLRSNSKMV